MFKIFTDPIIMCQWFFADGFLTAEVVNTLRVGGDYSIKMRDATGNVILQTGVFDEAFFMYCEEIDWQWRIRQAGWSIECVPSAHVVHLAGKSTSQIRAQSQINLWTSRLLLYQKHFPKWKLWLARWMIDLGMRRKARAVRDDSNLTDSQKLELSDAYEQIRRMAHK